MQILWAAPAAVAPYAATETELKTKDIQLILAKKKVMNQTRGQADMYKEKEKEKERGDGEMQYCVQ